MNITIAELCRRYPQLAFPIEAGISATSAYREAVLGGTQPPEPEDFCDPEGITFELAETPVGSVEILKLRAREDFVRAYRALAWKCEPREILTSVGAAMIRGLANWEKIRRHREDYLAADGEDWSMEFRRFTADKANYTDALILLSSGSYSAVPAEELGLPEGEWRELSMTIRQYHEITHFICRSLFPTDIEIIRDEVIADLFGLVAAFGRYEPALARRFLGIDGADFRTEGRLAHYGTAAELQGNIRHAEELIERVSMQFVPVPDEELSTQIPAFCRALGMRAE